MEIIPEGIHFRLVQDDELPAILNHLKQYLPEAIKFHQTIQTYLTDPIWKFYFYVSKKWPDEPICLHFPGCTLTPKDNVYGSFGVFCPSAHIECVDLLETETVLIDWTAKMYLNFTHIAIMNRIDSFYPKYGVMERLGGDIYVAQKPFQQIEMDLLPEDEVEMRPLNITNSKAIHDLYPAAEIESVEVFERLIGKLPGFGIFVHNTDELCAWMMHSYYGAMFSMQTRPQYRRKGYGIHLAQALTEKVIERGYSPFVVIRPQNDASRNLYTKLGYRKAFETTRVTLRPTAITNGCNGKLNGHANGHHVDNGNTNDTNGETNGDAQPKQNGNNQNKVADENGINASDELKQ